MPREPQEQPRLTGWFVAMLIVSATIGGVIALLGCLLVAFVSIAG